MFLIRKATSLLSTKSTVVPGGKGLDLLPIDEDRDMEFDDVKKELLNGEEDREGDWGDDGFEGFEDVEDQLKGELLQQEEAEKRSESKTKSKAKVAKKKQGGGKKGKKVVPELDIVEDEENTQSQYQDGSPDDQLNAETQEEVAEEESLPKKKKSTRTVNVVIPRRRAPRSHAILPPSKPDVLDEPDEDGDLVQSVKLLNDARMAAKARKAAALTELDTLTQGPPSTNHDLIQNDIYDLPSSDNLAFVAAKIEKIKKVKTRRPSNVRVDGDAVFRQPLTPAHVSHHAHRSPESDSAIALQLTGDTDAMASAVVEDEEEPERVSKKALGKRKARDELAVGSDAEEEQKRPSKKVFEKRKAAETMEPSLSDAEDEEPMRPSKKALGKRKAVDKPLKDSSKKRNKRTKDTGPPNRDIKNMFSSSTRRQASPEYERVQNSPNNTGPSVTPILSPLSKLIKSSQKPKAIVSPPSWNAINKPQPPEGDSDQGSSYQPDPSAADTTQETYRPSPAASLEPIVPQSSGSRKRRLPVEEPGPSNTKPKKYVGLKSQEPKSRTPKTPKTPKKPKTPTSKGQNLNTAPSTTGKLSAEDITAVTDAVESYKELNDLSQHEINELVQRSYYGGSEEKEFWKSVYGEVSWIPTKKVAQFCRRKYHNFEARGKWTDEQDEELKTAHERNPGKWTIIGREINRFSEDARDRWRNYLVCGDNMRKDTWDKDEENRLSIAVEESIAMIQAARRRSGGLRLMEDDESLIDWSKVSEKMDHTRSRLQCSYKWKALKKRQASDDEGGPTEKPISKTWRLVEAYDNARVLSADEKLRLLRAVRASGAGREGKIPWGRIRDELEETGKRMTWKVCFQKLKEKVAGYEDMKFAEILDELIDAFETAAPDEPDGFVIDTPARKKKIFFRASQSAVQFDVEVLEGGMVEGPSTSSKKKRKFRDRMMRENQPTKSTQDTEVNGNDEFDDEAPPTLETKRKVRNEKKSKSKSVEPTAEEGVDGSEDLATSLQALKSSQPRKPRAARKKAKAPINKSKLAQALSEEVVVEDPSDDEAPLPVNGVDHEDNYEAPLNDNAYGEMDIDQAEQQIANDDLERDDISEDYPENSHHDMESVDLDRDRTVTANGFDFNGEEGEEEDEEEDQEEVKSVKNGYDMDEEEEALNATQHDTESVDLDDTTPEDSPGDRFRELGSPVAFESKTVLDGLPGSDTGSISSDASSIPAKKPGKRSKKSNRSRLESLEL